MIDRYGGQSIYGRVLGVREVRRMQLAARTLNTALSFRGSPDWQVWQEQHPNDFDFLTYAIRLYKADNGRQS